MRTLAWNSLSDAERRAALARPGTTDRQTVIDSVHDIVNDVRIGGDRAVRMWTNRFDGFDGPVRPIPRTAFDEAWDAVEPELHAALDRAIETVSAFHEQLVPEPVTVVTAPGVTCSRVVRPLHTVGLYAPGGRAPLPSTVIMLGVPSRIAGCAVRVLCTPPNADGSVDPALLVAARKCGIDLVFAVGGPQAIAAMAYGTETIPRCDKLFGPGNRYVDAAKQLVASDPEGAALDLPAGPSEVMVLADANADPLFVASDLLAQAEHDVVAHVVLVTTSASLADEVLRILPRIAQALPDPSVATAALEHGVAVVVTDEVVSAESALADVANAYAAEHLIINTDDPAAVAARVTNAGSIFLGPWTPEVLGDYCSGTNHVLPTGGFSRAYSGLSVDSFMRFMTIQEASADGLLELGETAATIARAEGLVAHERSILARLRILHHTDDR